MEELQKEGRGGLLVFFVISNVMVIFLCWKALQIDTSHAEKCVNVVQTARGGTKKQIEWILPRH